MVTVSGAGEGMRPCWGVMVAATLPASRPKEKYFEDGKSRKEGPIYVLKLQSEVIWMLHNKLEKALQGTLICCVHEGLLPAYRLL